MSRVFHLDIWAYGEMAAYDALCTLFIILYLIKLSQVNSLAPDIKLVMSKLISRIDISRIPWQITMSRVFHPDIWACGEMAAYDAMCTLLIIFYLINISQDNSLAPAIKLVMLKLISRIDISRIPCQIAPRWMPQDLTDD